ncbi:MAG: hypothetical protein HY062_05485 [Bacteroidetes bacterium]|nr:hypothetical protein [Bacteroidota bacterium]
MKTINVFVCMIFMNITTLTVFSQKGSGVSQLEITGAALLNDSRTNDYAISVYLDGTKIDSMYNKSKRKIKFYVNYNQVYTFLFQKQGCKDKILIVNTIIPEGLKEMQDDTFDFEVEMTQSLTKNSEEIEDYPVAVLNINKKEELLQASESYYQFTHQDWDLTTVNVSDATALKKSKHK